jgi:hypothetical protein
MFLRSVLARVMALVLFGCTSPLFAQESASLVLYRFKRFEGSALEPPIYCDGRLLAKADNGRYFVVSLAPGRHELTTNSKASGTFLNLAAGEVKYVRVEIQTGFVKGSGKLIPVDSEQGEFEVGKLKPLDGDKIKLAEVVSTSLPKKTGASSLAAPVARPAPAMTPRVEAKTVAEPPAANPLPDASKKLGYAEIVEIKGGGLSDETVLSLAKSKGVQSLSTAQLVALKGLGLKEETIVKLIEMGSSK